MCVVDAVFYPLIVTRRPTDSLYRQPPMGTDMGGSVCARLLTFAPVTGFSASSSAPEPEPSRHLMQSVACFPALPAPLNGYIALDGQSDVWHDEETC
ncbi:hypothetical protein ID875_20840 [Streptomyces globisporus]|uniref:Uncharacterized protein n=1 Tax=Streptomyces globisporus TaxID=1908 RepID=A0A927GPD7_STRGL|nr:hypothetical protein [Streptomyces globisporus]